ncbi:glucoamylase family protein [Parapedobacter sp. 10938]|uniref:glucoamylase family protein n=1 Tax=Parapedobacter flavus TaxID=3110225 RepID=UPI002DC019D0|nr:glucoamylase family protein [Parapedobacter sp. 10938]MEC3879249.1 glucoamylase family protein [Parapedobacter sp. 10938]
MNHYIYTILIATVTLTACNGANQQSSNHNGDALSDDSLLTLVQQQTFQYFWDGAEPVSGLARERIHIDGEYAQNDQEVVTIGGSGFGLMAIIVGMERGFITRQAGVDRFENVLDYLAKADRFHGAWPHWLDGPTGKAKPFSKNDNGGDIVETAFMAQALICVREYFQQGNEQEKQLAARADALWKAIEWDWYRQYGQNVLYWHWSPTADWAANHPIRGYDECLITYVLAASSPTYGVPAEVYHEGWARGGAITTDAERYGHPIILKHNVPDSNGVGPLFWSHYSYLGLDPRGLKDQYADYWELNRNHALIHYDYAIDNPKGYKGYGSPAGGWGFTASYSVKGYAAHNPDNDRGVISPTAALSSLPYTPEHSMEMIRYLYEELGDKVWGKYGFYDAYSETENWYPQRYLAIDQGPIPVMIENHRTGLLWDLFMGAPEIQVGLRKLGFESPKI